MDRRLFLQQAGTASLAALVAQVAPIAANAQTGKPMPKGKQEIIIGASTGYGLSYLPLTIMEDKKLLEQHAARFGLDVAMRFQRFPTPGPMYDDLLSGKIAFAAGGITQLLTSWEKTRTNPELAIKGVAALDAMPLYLVTSNPKIRTIADFTPTDKIALVAVRTSIEAVVLSMAAEKTFGKGQAGRLNSITTAMGHPEAMKALLDRSGGIDAHLASSPFFDLELASPGIHTVLDSYNVLDGPHTHNVVWTTTKFDETNPKVVEAYLGALQESLDFIKSDPATAAALYVKSGDVQGISNQEAEKFIRNLENEWTMTPKKFMAFATFMKQIGLISVEPAGWHELFFENVWHLPGS